MKSIVLAAATALAVSVSGAEVKESNVKAGEAGIADAGSALVVPAHRFDAGGWKMDAQFIDVIGAPYLLAHGFGNRVMDATVSVEVPEAGDYRIWAYTRNWASGAPGRFKVAVNGRVLPNEFGSGSREWGWVAGGTVPLKKGRATLALKDQTGFDGRCAGLALVRGAGRPEGAPDPRRLPVAETLGAEFVVVGGGMPGTCAAVAAARRGVKTVLVQDRPVLGGNASSEIRVWCAGEARYDLVRELRGRFMNMEDYVALSDARRMGIVLNEPNLTVLLSTRVFAAEKGPDGAIAAVKAFDLKRGCTVRIEAPLFADATGDGWLGFYAGADFRMGREARSEFGEPAEFAPEKADNDTLGASLMWTSVDGNAPVSFSAPWAEPHAQGEVKVNGEWNWEYGIHRDMIAEGEAVRDRLLLAIYGSFSLAKKNPENANRELNFVPYILGKRESRRLMGDHIYSCNDVVNKVQFEDAIAAGSWSVDLHYDNCKPGVDFLTTCVQPHYGRYWIPYRSIYSRNIPNLFAVGRCFSCTHVGLGGARVINTLSQLGCAAGEAAALCKKYGIRPRDIYTEGRVREVQDALGGEFPGRPDPKIATWLIVDDESGCATFGKGWRKEHCANGEQYGEYAHFTGGSAYGPNPRALPSCGEAVYRLNVPEKGRYALMGRIPFIRTSPAGSATAFKIVSGGKEIRFTANQALSTGMWRELGEFELEPGATLTIIPKESRGIVAADVFALVPRPAPAGKVAAGGDGFRDDPAKYWDVPALMKAPRFRPNPFPDSDTPGMKSFLVAGKGPDGAEAEFFCTYALPETPKPEKGYPAVMLVHGGGGTAFPCYIDHWRRNGFAVMAIDWYNQRPVVSGTHSNKHDVAREPLPGGKRNDLRANIANIVLANSLLRSMPETDPSRNVYVGLSWGSWYGAAIAGIDNRYSGIMEIYCGDVRTKKGRELVNGRFLHRATMPVWWATWTQDQNVTPKSSQAGWDECPTYWGHVTSPTLGHSHKGFTLDCVMRMAKFFAGEGPALPRLGGVELKEGVLSAPVTGFGKSTGKAFLVYTDDSENELKPAKRVWKHVAAELVGDRVSAPLPEGALIAYLTLNENPSEDRPSAIGGSSHFWFAR